MELFTPEFFDIFGFMGFLILTSIGISLIKIAKKRAIALIAMGFMGVIIDGYIVITNFII